MWNRIEVTLDVHVHGDWLKQRDNSFSNFAVLGDKKSDLLNQMLEFQGKRLVRSLYRPFNKQWLYFDSGLNHRQYQMPKIFPEAETKNLVIWTVGTGSSLECTPFISDFIPDLQGPAKIQCFPLYLYDQPEATASNDLFSNSPSTLPAATPSPTPASPKPAATRRWRCMKKSLWRRPRL